MKRYKIFTIIAVFLLLCSITAPLPALAQEWTISKSKTAGSAELDKDMRAKVTLSLPAAQKSLETDIVFVLDKSTSADVEEDIIQTLTELKQHAAGTQAKVNVGVVIFNKQANVTCGLTDLETGYETILEAVRTDISSGTNTHAGLLAGKRMLDEDLRVSADRKYLIFISDAITYIYNETPSAVASQFSEGAIFAGPDSWANKYGNNTPPADWEQWLSDAGEQIAQDGEAYDINYGEAQPYIPYQERSEHAMTVDKALYYTAQVYKSAKDAGYKCYSLTADIAGSAGGEYPWGPSYMEYLAGGETVSFDKIYNDVIYLLDAGSTVIDIIGQGSSHEKDGGPLNKPYDFKFVNSAGQLALTVGGVPYNVTELDSCKYAFGNLGDSKDGQDYPFVLEYYPEGSASEAREHFIWRINVPVDITAPAALTYSVQLTHPQQEAGVYSKLYTNQEAVLNPVDTYGGKGESEYFERPEVSYKVQATDPSRPTGDCGYIAYAAALAVCVVLAVAFKRIKARG